MKARIKLLKVKLNDQLVGHLAIGDDLLCRFEYDQDWLKNGFSISPFHLPLKNGLFVSKREPFDGVFGVFADSMPDGWGNLLLDRFLLSQGINPTELSALDRLAFVGAQGLGALSYEPDHSVTNIAIRYDLNKIATQVANILTEQADIPTVKALLKKTGSSGGARPKVLVKHEGETWMIKFPSSTDPKDIGSQEVFYGNLAKKCGIEMSAIKLFEGKYFGTKLFDRNDEQRFHMHSVAGLMHASHRYPSLDYTQLAKATMLLTKNQKQVAKLLRLMTYNVAIENKDDHSKNFSFLYKNNEWKISPAYDILKSEGFSNEHATAINGVGNPTKNDLFAVAKNVNFPKKEMNSIIEQVIDWCKSAGIKPPL